MKLRRRIECLLENTEEDDLLEGVSSDENDDSTLIYEPHDQNTDTEPGPDLIKLGPRAQFFLGHPKSKKTS
jgi:hypothetical protein